MYNLLLILSLCIIVSAYQSEEDKDLAKRLAGPGGGVTFSTSTSTSYATSTSLASTLASTTTTGSTTSTAASSTSSTTSSSSTSSSTTSLTSTTGVATPSPTPTPAPTVSTPAPSPSPTPAPTTPIPTTIDGCSLPQPFGNLTCINGTWQSTSSSIVASAPLTISSPVHIDGNLTITAPTTTLVGNGSTPILIVQGNGNFSGILVVNVTSGAHSIPIAIVGNLTHNFDGVIINNENPNTCIQGSSFDYSNGQLSLLIKSSDSPCSDASSSSKPPIALIAGISGGVLLITIIVAAILAYKYRKWYSCGDDKS